MRMAIRRGFVVGLGFIIQILFYVFIMIFFADHFPVINVVYRILGLLIVLSIIKNSRSLDVSLPWIMVILIEPILGTLLYLSLGNMLFTSRTLRRLRQSTQNAQKYYLRSEGEKNPCDLSQGRRRDQARGHPYQCLFGKTPLDGELRCVYQ